MKDNYKFNGQWIQGEDIDYGQDDALYYQDHHNVILENTFKVLNKKDIQLYIASLGYYIIYINNHRVSSEELNNDWTNFQHCVYYEKYDISDYVVDGKNTITIELGNGMYNPSPLRLFGKYNLRERLSEVGQPKVLLDIVSNNDIILTSDKSWKYRFGNLLFNNLYLGEKVDLGYQDDILKDVVVTNKDYHLEKSFIPKVQRHQIVDNYEIKDYQDGLLIDFKEMISGFITIELEMKQPSTVIIQYSENVDNGNIDFTTVLAGSVGEDIKDMTIPGGPGAPKYAISTDTLICKQGYNAFTNKFCYHSFRYAYVKGCQKEDIKKINAIYVHTDLSFVGHIDTDNQTLNQLYDAANHTKLNNVHGVFEDCARERLGYGGDVVALATSNLYTFDLKDMYKKVIHDFRYTQTENGGVAETAPYVGIQSNGTGDGEGPLLWQLVYPYLVRKHYQYYGDIDLLKEEYPYLIKQLNYLINLPIQEVVHKCLGDHGSILIAGEFRKPTPDKVLLGYCAILLFLKNNMKIGTILNKDVSSYQKRFNELKDLVIKEFTHNDGTFGENTQTGLAFATYLQLGNPQELCQKLVDKIIEDNNVLNSGIFGMSLTYEVLNTYGYNDIIEKWLLQDSDVSYLKMLKTGNQALAELFIGEHLSLNHAMFASYPQWYYQALAGINIQEDAVGFNKVILKPYFSTATNQVDCTLDTIHGRISSSWKRSHHQIEWTITVPKDIQYTIDVEERDDLKIIVQ